MDPALVNALIGTGGTLCGALVGGFTTYKSTTVAHAKLAKKDRDDARRVREHEAIKQCEALCLEMADRMKHARHPAELDHTNEDDDHDEAVNATHHQLRAEALYLPASMRTRVEEIAAILHNADEIAYGCSAYGSTHYDRPYAICWNLRMEIRQLTAAALKGDPLPAPAAIVAEYLVALKDLENHRAEIYADMGDLNEGRQREREAFYERHPEFNPDVESSDSKGKRRSSS